MIRLTKSISIIFQDTRLLKVIESRFTKLIKINEIKEDEKLIPNLILKAKSVFYMRSGGETRLFFKYLDKEQKTVQIIAESNKNGEDQVIRT